MLRGTIVLLVSLFAVNASAMQWQEEPFFIGHWEMYFGTSELDDSEGVMASINDDWRGHNSSNWVMQVGCLEGRPVVVYGITHEGEFISDEQIPVAYRLDENPARQETWFKNSSGSAVLIDAEQAREFLSELGTADELFIRAKPSNFPNRDARFLLLGVREVVYQVRKLCPVGE